MTVSSRNRARPSTAYRGVPFTTAERRLDLAGRLVLGAFLGALLTAAPLLAQQGGAGAPIVIRPPQQPAPQQPGPQQPAPPAAGETPLAPRLPSSLFQANPAGNPSGGQGVETRTLAPIGADGLGLARDDEELVFGPPQWQETPWTVAVDLVRGLPAQTPAPVLRQIARRLLTTAANPPANSGAGGAREGAFLDARLNRLGAMGFWAEAAEIAAMTPASRRSDEARRRLVEADLIRGRTDEGCKAIDTQRDRTEAYWLRARIACLALTGKRDEANLLIQVLREQGQDSDGLSLMAEAVGGNDAAIAGLSGDASAAWDIYAALLARAQAKPLPDAALAALTPQVAAILALGEPGQQKLPLDTRIEAALTAAAGGTVPISVVVDLFNQYQPFPTDLDSPAAAAGKSPAMALALLHRIALSTPSPKLKAEAVGEALRRAGGVGSGTPDGARIANPGRLRLMAELLRAQISDLAPTPDAAAIAPIVARAVLLGGEADQIQTWLGLARQSPASQSPALQSPAGQAAGQTAVERSRLYLLGRVALGDDYAALAAGDLADAAAAELAVDARSGPIRAAFAFAVLEGLGDAIPSPAWAAFLGQTIPPATLPNPTGWLQMRSAAEGFRIGEAAALALIQSGGRPFVPADGLRLGGILTSLRFAGLEAEARRLAVDALIRAGF